MVVEGDDSFGRPRQVGDDEGDARAQLARVPLHLGHDAPRFLPALRLDPPPLKWSTLSYGLAKEDRDAEEELQARRDRRQAAAG